MRKTEKIVAILIVVLATWSALMMAVTSFQGSQSNRILLVELGSDATTLARAVQANGTNDHNGVAHNIQMVVRNTYLDFVFILLYWSTVVGLCYLAAKFGQRVLAVCAAVSITAAAIADLLENDSILVAMHVKDFTDAVAVDIWEYAQAKWMFFFLAVLLLGLAIALNLRTSNERRITGYIFVASGVFGLMGIVRNSVSLGFAFMMINLAVGLFAIALLLTLWKFYHSLKELGELEHSPRAHAHA
ncbi:MAG TPA: hypothetical protein VE779_02740 [Candidatus Angelobacter sp.]|jgi:hypothetical protein|nr:hypothetical protein [Candidatus Angelobacter sp.]